MISIDEAIAKYKEIANTDAICPGHCNIPCEQCVQESEQLAEWLEELKSYRASVFSGYMTQKMLKEEYNKAIDDYTEKAKAECKVHYVDCNPYFGGIKDSILYEDDIDEIAEQLKAGGENERM